MNLTIFLKAMTILLAGILLSGCKTSSGVVSLGQNTYMVTRTTKGFVGSAAPVKAEALKEANAY
jgi:hypothetical protein